MRITKAMKRDAEQLQFELSDFQKACREIARFRTTQESLLAKIGISTYDLREGEKWITYWTRDELPRLTIAITKILTGEKL